MKTMEQLIEEVAREVARRLMGWRLSREQADLMRSRIDEELRYVTMPPVSNSGTEAVQ